LVFIKEDKYKVYSLEVNIKYNYTVILFHFGQLNTQYY